MCLSEISKLGRSTYGSETHSYHHILKHVIDGVFELFEDLGAHVVGLELGLFFGAVVTAALRLVTWLRAAPVGFVFRFGFQAR